MNKAPDGQRVDRRSQLESELAGLYEEYYDRIARYAFVHIGDRADSEDIAGEVFLKALRSLDSYQERGVPMQAWLFKIAHNLVVDYLRRKAKAKAQAQDMEVLQIADDDPVKEAETKIQMEKVSEAMKKLTPDQRQVISLRFMSGLASKEVAQAMKKSDGAVREMQRAAIEKLRALLAVEA